MEETLQGGYRINGQSPVKEAGLPVVSVITVVYNSLSLIEKTITSIVSQSYPNIEFIVIDGGSSDGTVEIIRLYDKHISYWISEPDHGIYDAMNKGLEAASGDYVWFMNAGDRIYAADILEKIFPFDRGSAMGKGCLVYFGDTMIVDSEYREVGLRRLRPPEVLTWKSFKKGMLVCHQAIIVNREIAEPFDPQYKHSADFDWVVRMLKKAEGDKPRAQGSRLKAQVGSREYGVGSKGEQELIIDSELQTGGSRRREGAEPTHDSGIIAPQPLNPSTHQPITNTHLVLCAFLDGGHSKKNIGISLRERFHSMVRYYGLIPTVLRHIPIVVRFGWYYLINRRF
ncbi:MAG: glycosyltransferase family 2 protein [Bacteroidia bacterium]|nr:glycosyltransferase family 2 protein [Bacteroidia bacterium]